MLTSSCDKDSECGGRVDEFWCRSLHRSYCYEIQIREICCNSCEHYKKTVSKYGRIRTGNNTESLTLKQILSCQSIQAILEYILQNYKCKITILCMCMCMCANVCDEKYNVCLFNTGCEWGDKQTWCDTVTNRDCQYAKTQQACCDSCG